MNWSRTWQLVMLLVVPLAVVFGGLGLLAHTIVGTSLSWSALGGIVAGGGTGAATYGMARRQQRRIERRGRETGDHDSDQPRTDNGPSGPLAPNATPAVVASSTTTAGRLYADLATAEPGPKEVVDRTAATQACRAGRRSFDSPRSRGSPSFDRRARLPQCRTQRGAKLEAGETGGKGTAPRPPESRRVASVGSCRTMKAWGAGRSCSTSSRAGHGSSKSHGRDHERGPVRGPEHRRRLLSRENVRTWSSSSG